MKGETSCDLNHMISKEEEIYYGYKEALGRKPHLILVISKGEFLQKFMGKQILSTFARYSSLKQVLLPM
jgi:hypothetical protein